MSVGQFHKWLAQRGFVRADDLPVPEECAGQAVFKMPLVSETKATKGTDGELRVRAIMTTPSVDRQGDIVVPKGVSLKWFKKNPVVMWAHQYNMPPIGVVDTKTLAVSDKGIEADVVFDKGSVAGQEVFGLYQRKVMRGWSIGFIPTKWEVITDPKTEKFTGYQILKCELLELSAAPVPANPDTLSRQIQQVDEYAAKGYEAGAFHVVKSLRAAIEPFRKAAEAAEEKAAEEKAAKAEAADESTDADAPNDRDIAKALADQGRETLPEHMAAAPPPAPVMATTTKADPATPKDVENPDEDKTTDALVILKDQAIDAHAAEMSEVLRRLADIEVGHAGLEAKVFGDVPAEDVDGPDIMAMLAEVKEQLAKAVTNDGLKMSFEAIEGIEKRMAAIEATEAERQKHEAQLEADRKRKEAQAQIDALADAVSRKFGAIVKSGVDQKFRKMRGAVDKTVAVPLLTQ